MSYASTVLADSPVGFWELDEASGTSAADSSGNSHTGTYLNTPTLAVAPLITAGNAVTFLATSLQSVDIPLSAAFAANGKITLEAWIKTTQSGAANPNFVGADPGTGVRYFQFRLGASGQLEAIFFDSGGTPHTFDGSVVVNDGNAHHVAVTYDAAHVIFYVDGNLDTSTAATFILLGTSPDVFIGARTTDSGSNFTGTIDEVALYTAALTGTRIAAHHAAGIASGPPAPSGGGLLPRTRVRLRVYA